LFYVLLEGRARLTQVTVEGHQVIVHYVGPGDGVGIIVALSSMAYPVSAEAVEACEALSWDADTISQLMLECPRLALNGMRLIARRFADLQDRYRELATERVERRVARALLRLVRQMGRRVEGGVLIDIPLSRQDLAEMTGTTLYTVSRILSRWEEQGLVDLGRERVMIRKSHDLVIIAEDLPHNEH
jgi:CRP-like cAMP-binding protein